MARPNVFWSSTALQPAASTYRTHPRVAASNHIRATLSAAEKFNSLLSYCVINRQAVACSRFLIRIGAAMDLRATEGVASRFVGYVEHLERSDRSCGSSRTAGVVL
jgi:hypothetical protein